MDVEALQKKYDRLFESVKAMRGYQKQYRKYFVRQDREIMIIKERAVDNLIAMEAAEKKKMQKELF